MARNRADKFDGVAASDAEVSSDELGDIAGYIEVPTVDPATLPVGEVPSPEGASTEEELTPDTKDVPEDALVTDGTDEEAVEPTRSRYNLVTNADGVLVRAEAV